MSDRKQELLKALEQQVDAKKTNKIKSWRPYAKQRDFIEATADHNEVACLAGNQTGKSTTGGFEAAVFATGLYPSWWKGRRFAGPTRGWAIGESTVATRDVSQRILCGTPNDPSALGTGFIPKSCIVGTVLAHGAGGAYDSIKVKHVSGGVSTIGFKSYEMDRSKLQGETLDWIWCDEEPTLDIYTELLARTIATNGLVFSTFTPLNGLNQIVPRFRERSPEAQRDRIIIRMRMADAEHLADPDRQRALLAMFPEHQRKARLDGVPMLGSGAVFDTPLEDLIEPLTVRANKVIHRDIGDLNIRGWAFAWSIDFGISHPFAATLLGWDRDNDIIYVLAELRIRNATPAQHAQRMKAIAVNAPVIWPHDGHSRERGSGLELARLYKNEGLHMSGTHATFSTGGYSTEAGISDMQQRFQSGRLKIAAACVELQEEYQSYHRKDGLLVKEGDDLLSALRIGVMAIRSARPVSLGSKKSDPSGNGGGRFVRGHVNRDPFGF